MQIEKNNIYHGDCLEIMPFIEDKSIDMILCDLPYGITSCKWDKIIPIDKLWQQYNRIIKDNGAIILTATIKFAIDLINANRKYFKYDIVWQKKMAVGFSNAKHMPLRKHELILVFYNKAPTYNPQGLVKLDKPMHIKKRHSDEKDFVYRTKLDKPYEREFTNYPASVWTIPNSNHKSLHPTQKPVKLFEDLIKTYTNAGELVLDNCIGSGTTAIACIETKRNYIGIELNKDYFDVSCKRIAEALEAIK